MDEDGDSRSGTPLSNMSEDTPNRSLPATNANETTTKVNFALHPQNNTLFFLFSVFAKNVRFLSRSSTEFDFHAFFKNYNVSFFR